MIKKTQKQLLNIDHGEVLLCLEKFIVVLIYFCNKTKLIHFHCFGAAIVVKHTSTNEWKNLSLWSAPRDAFKVKSKVWNTKYASVCLGRDAINGVKYLYSYWLGYVGDFSCSVTCRFPFVHFSTWQEIKLMTVFLRKRPKGTKVTAGIKSGKSNFPATVHHLRADQATPWRVIFLECREPSSRTSDASTRSRMRRSAAASHFALLWISQTAAQLVRQMFFTRTLPHRLTLAVTGDLPCDFVSIIIS